jgi:hypothetical protein
MRIANWRVGLIRNIPRMWRAQVLPRVFQPCLVREGIQGLVSASEPPRCTNSQHILGICCEAPQCESGLHKMQGVIDLKHCFPDTSGKRHGPRNSKKLLQNRYRVLVGREGTAAPVSPKHIAGQSLGMKGNPRLSIVTAEKFGRVLKKGSGPFEPCAASLRQWLLVQ